MSDQNIELANLLRQALDDPFTMGRLRRLIEDQRLGTWSGGPIGGGGSQTADPEEAASDDKITHAIQFRVVDDESGSPQSNVALTVKLTTGETRKFITDGNGMIRISGIPGGTCDITRMVDTEAFEVISVQSA